MMKQIFRMLSCAVALQLASPAQAFTTPNGVQVKPVDDQVFEVIPRNSGDVYDFWCGASEYARRVLGAGWRDPIYVVRGRGASVTTNKRSAVQFSLSPDLSGALVGDRGLITTGLKPGDSMSVQQARTYCNRQPIRF